MGFCNRHGVCFLAVQTELFSIIQMKPLEMKVREFRRTSEALWTGKVAVKVVCVLN
jgi:hypothetical protein